MSSEQSEKILSRIKALLAKARGTENEHEALAFSTKAQELLATYNLTEADLEIDGKAEAAIRSHMETSDINACAWRNRLWLAVAKLYFCDVYMQTTWVGDKERKFPVFVGREHNIAVAVEMSKYLISTTLRLAAQFSKERAVRLNFEKGCGLRLVQRIYQMVDQLTLPQGDGSGLPALYASEELLIEKFYTSRGLTISPARKSKISAGLGYSAGHHAGGKINLGAQVGQRG